MPSRTSNFVCITLLLYNERHQWLTKASHRSINRSWPNYLTRKTFVDSSEWEVEENLFCNIYTINWLVLFGRFLVIIICFKLWYVISMWSRRDEQTEVNMPEAKFGQDNFNAIFVWLKKKSHGVAALCAVKLHFLHSTRPGLQTEVCWRRT